MFEIEVHEMRGQQPPPLSVGQGRALVTHGIPGGLAVELRRQEQDQHANQRDPEAAVAVERLQHPG